jgi:dipeptidyl aminopeptidase/acylaminoacyl peptidase
VVIGALAMIAAASTLDPRAGATIADILGVTDISGVSASPDGSWVAFRTDRPRLDTNDYESVWYVVPIDASAPPRRVADGGAMLFTDAGVAATQLPVWAPTSKAFYYRALVDGQVQVWRATIAADVPRQVSHDAADVRALRLDPVGGSLAYETGATREALAEAEARNDDDGTLVDATVDLTQPLVRGSVIDGKPASERLTGRWFDRGDLLWRTPLRSRVLALPPEDSQPVVRAANGPTTAGPIESPMRLPGGCVPDHCLDGRWLSSSTIPGRRAVLVATLDRAHAETLSVWGPRDREGRVLNRFAGLASGDRRSETPCAVTARVAVCVEASASIPPRLIAIDLTRGKRTILFAPNVDLEKRMTIRPRPMRWTTLDGTIFTGVYFPPAGATNARPSPLVIHYYACDGFLRGGVGDEVPMLPLAASGIAVLCINQPWGAPRSQTSPADYDRAIAGIATIVDRLAANGVIDKSRVGITGLSFGSEIAYQAMWRLPYLRAAATSTGTLDPGFYWVNALPGRDTASALERVWGVGRPDEDKSGWARVSPLAHVDDMRAALLMQLPEQEARWSPEFHARLAATGTPVEVYAYADEAHIKRSPRHKLAVYSRTYDWLRFWLLGVEDPTPNKAEQYARWRAMSVRRRAAG